MSDARTPHDASSAKPAETEDALIGRALGGRFQIVSLLARGGMGKVYRAVQTPLGREVALKVLDAEYSGSENPEFERRFFLEASTAARLAHPNTVKVFDYGRTDDGLYFIAMELLDGLTLYRLIRLETRLPRDRAVHIAVQICRSVREAHGLGVVHRDLKPANVFVIEHEDEPDFVKVLDFGLVKELEREGDDLTETGLFVGSPKYVAPEQIQGEKLDGRADVYSIGVILYEMFTGVPPFDRPNAVAILMAHVNDPPPTFAEVAPDLVPDAAFEAVVMKAISKAREDRFGSVDELLFALKSLVVGSLSALESGESLPPAPSPEPVAPAFEAAASRRTEPEGRPRWPGQRVAAVAMAVAGATASIVWLIARDPAAESPTSRTMPPEPTPPEPTPRSAHVEIVSEPSGAMVRIGAERYGPTPVVLELPLPGSGAETTFEIQLEGHRSASVTRVIEDGLRVSATLEPMADAGAPAMEPLPARRFRRPATMMLEGYKAVPY